MHRRRVYIETASDQYTELPYIQPALEFDPKTGLPAEGSGEVPEHLMVHFLDGEPDKERLASAVDGIYRWCNIYPEGFFRNVQAYEAHKVYVAKIRNHLANFVFNSGHLRLLSANEREICRQQGTKIIEHWPADH
jgi:hypothetical protein